MSARDSFDSLHHVAIVGMACRFPGARSVEEFWRNLRDGVESIRFFSDQELLEAGVDPALLDDPSYVKAGGFLEDVDLFDAAFFGLSPKEAAMMDPQHRLFLECAWQALEAAGYHADAYKGRIGVFAGAGRNTYFLTHLMTRPDLAEAIGDLPAYFGNEKDFVSTRVSYRLNLKGPSINVQTACSTSLVAVHLACQSLLNGECDMALAGGVSVTEAEKAGYFYQEGGIYSPDGHCRAFDANARGMVGGNGVGVVVLKRLADALDDGDAIDAVIRGSAVNNDGSAKIGYAAPSVDGQARVISEALAVAEVSPATVTYVETHGTGTPLGDPIEVAALTQAFRAGTDSRGFCAIGSLKTNIGHVNAAAGVAGVIKAALALKHALLPPSLHFEEPNPNIDFANSPFYVNAILSEWSSGDHPRRAGVSSFGMGGTNAHVVLEEAPPRQDSPSSRPWHLVALSAKTSSALDSATRNLVDHLRQHPDAEIADLAYTLLAGRKRFAHRRIAVCRDLEDLASTLQSGDPQRASTRFQEAEDRPVAFLFPGQGTQYVHMGHELYRSESTFRQWVDHCSERLEPDLGIDLRHVLYPHENQTEAATRELRQTRITQPALFTTEYALARLWMTWGVHPVAMIGHSIGEYVAACLAGVLSLEDALILVAARGRQMQELPSGAMLAVSLPVSAAEELLGERLSLAAINEPSLCVVSGPTDAVDALEARLARESVPHRRLHTSHAFHSTMMDPVLESFAETVRKIELRPPRIPYVSNVTGTWITPEDATNPDYWARHLRETVRFAAGVGELLADRERILLEVGPGRSLSTAARRHPEKTPEHAIVTSMRHPEDAQSDLAFLLSALGHLWVAGAGIDWTAFHAAERRHRVPLPAYPFERKRHWVERGDGATRGGDRSGSTRKGSNVAQWFYVPSWKRSSTPAARPSELQRDRSSRTLVFVDGNGLAASIVAGLRQMGDEVATVAIGKHFVKRGEDAYEIDPREPGDYQALVRSLEDGKAIPSRIVHLWGIGSRNESLEEVARVEEAQELGFYSLLFLSQALRRYPIASPLRIAVVTTDLHEVTGEERLCPEKATVLGPCRVIPQEHPNVICRNIDGSASTSAAPAKLVEQLTAELVSDSPDPIVAYRGAHRWLQTFAPVRLDDHATSPGRLRRGGVYLITGGLGRVGLALAEHLARTEQAKLALLGRSKLPPRNRWDDWLAAHGDDPVSEAIRRVRSLEEHGAEVLLLSADVTNARELTAAIDSIDRRFGTLHGVVHAAGLTDTDSFLSIQQLGRPDAELHLQPKVYGLLAVESALRGRPLDFCMLTSSISGSLGGIGFAAYAAANLFMDAFAQSRNLAGGTRWTSVQWDGWEFASEPKQGAAYGANVASFAMTRAEGVEAFRRILSAGPISQWVVSTGDLDARMRSSLAPPPHSPRRTKADRNEGSAMGLDEPPSDGDVLLPRTPIESLVAEIWQQALGVEQVGVLDTFFDLGGDSLVLLQVISRLERELGLRLSPRELAFQTLGQLASACEERLEARPGSERTGMTERLLRPIKRAFSYVTR